LFKYCSINYSRSFSGIKPFSIASSTCSSANFLALRTSNLYTLSMSFQVNKLLKVSEAPSTTLLYYSTKSYIDLNELVPLDTYSAALDILVVYWSTSEKRIAFIASLVAWLTVIVLSSIAYKSASESNVFIPSASVFI